ncbi:MAG: hypothetical protein FWF05_01470 [Oscillospiraceae bacterium]|nr:hypothetical protein [Oscillospiraceae bacterium]
MTLTEKAAYLKGLAEGLSLDAEKPETKLFNAILDVIDDLALTSSDLEDSVALLSEQLDAVDEDLDELEEYVYDEFDDDDDMFDDDEEYFEVECPACGEVVCVDEQILEEGSLNCPSCNELLELELDEDDGEE